MKDFGSLDSFLTGEEYETIYQESMKLARQRIATAEDEWITNMSKTDILKELKSICTKMQETDDWEGMLLIIGQMEFVARRCNV